MKLKLCRRFIEMAQFPSAGIPLLLFLLTRVEYLAILKIKVDLLVTVISKNKLT
jgi:hypothetical protein